MLFIQREMPPTCHPSVKYVYQACILTNGAEELKWVCSICETKSVAQNKTGARVGVWSLNTASNRLTRHAKSLHQSVSLDSSIEMATSQSGRRFSESNRSEEVCDLFENVRGSNVVIDLDNDKANEEDDDVSPSPRLCQSKLSSEHGVLASAVVTHSTGSLRLASGIVQFAAENNLPFRIFESQSWFALYKEVRYLPAAQTGAKLDTPSRKALKNRLTFEANSAKQEMMASIRGKTALILADGGTLMKVHTQIAKSVIAQCLDVLEKRKMMNFENMAVRHLQYLTPPFSFTSSVKSKMASEIVPLFPGITEQNILHELNDLLIFEQRGACKDLKTFRTFWDSHTSASNFVILSKYVRILTDTAVTEAAVERSFSIQGKIQCGSRNRISNETVNAFMLVKDGERRKKKRRIEQQNAESPVPRMIDTTNYQRLSMTFEDWQKNVAAFSENKPLARPFANSGVRTRKTSKFVYKFGNKINVRKGATMINDAVLFADRGDDTYEVKAADTEMFIFDPAKDFWTINSST